MYLADKINKKLEQSGLKQYIGQEISCIQLRKTLNHALRSFGIRVRLSRDSDVSMNFLGQYKKRMFAVSGEYDDERKSKAITLTIHIAPNRKKIKLNVQKMDSLIFRIAQTAQHELLHKSQFKLQGQW